MPWYCRALTWAADPALPLCHAGIPEHPLDSETPFLTVHIMQTGELKLSNVLNPRVLHLLGTFCGRGGDPDVGDAGLGPSCGRLWCRESSHPRQRAFLPAAPVWESEPCSWCFVWNAEGMFSRLCFAVELCAALSCGMPGAQGTPALPWLFLSCCKALVTRAAPDLHALPCSSATG